MAIPETVPTISRRLLPWCVALTVAVLPMLVTLVTPPGRDQGLFCYSGWRLLEGDAPYLQVWDHKPPAIHAAYALALSLGGLNFQAVVWLSLLVRLATAWLLGRILAHLTGGRNAPVWLVGLAGLTLLLWDGRFWSLAQPEAFMNLWIALGLLLALRGRLFLAGAALVTACWFKPVALLWAPLLGLAGAGFFALAEAPVSWRQRLTPVAWRMFIGAALGCLPWLVWLAARGVLAEFRSAVAVFNSFHAGGGVLVDRWHRTVEFGRQIWLPGLLATAVPLTLRLRPRAAGTRAAAVFFAAWFTAACGAVALQRKFFDYHLVLLVPPLVALAVLTVARVWHARMAGGSRGVRAGAMGLGLALFAVWCGPLWNRQLSLPTQRTLGRISPSEFEDAFREAHDFSYPADRDFAVWLARTTEPGDGVQIMGFEPLVNFLARRPAASRFCFDYPINFSPASPAAERWRDQARRQLRDDLREHPPRIIALMRNDANAIEKDATVKQMQDISWFKELIAGSYDPVGVKEDFVVFQRRESAPGR